MIVSKGIGRLWLCVAVLICATATPVLLDAAEPAASDLRQRLDSLQQQIEANSSALEKGRIELQRVLRESDAKRTIVGNKNFLVNAPTREMGERILAAAELCRDRIAVEWFGDTLADGQESASIHVELRDTDEGGFTLLCDPKRRFSGRHRIWLNTTRDRALGGTLAHEIAHVVLNARFADGMAAWANEGIASRLDDSRRAAIRQETLKNIVQTGRWPSLQRLLNQPQIKSTDRVGYSVAVSVTEFLLSRGSRARFLDFVELGQRTGWDTAVRRIYGIADVEQLRRDWRRSLSSEK